MCGIVATFRRNGGAELDANVVRRMVRSLALRGPDEHAVRMLGDISLGHARLSIIDVSGGSQPIFNENERIACILNGEIYNYRDLTAELTAAGHMFRTRSDTECLVHLYEQHGAEGVDRTVGMFAYVIADLDRHRMLVFRDRIGEKPLYYWDTPELFACASEIKALRHLPHFDDTIDQESLAEYLRFGWISAPRSIYRHVKQLMPGHYIVVDHSHVEIHRYWHPRPAHSPRRLERAECVAELTELLSKTVPGKLVADVPTGLLLSGGLDSSAIAAFAQRAHSEPLKTFSAGFGAAINELPQARLVSTHFGTHHEELMIDSGDVIEDLLRIAEYLDEPFMDSSCLPTYRIARAARDRVQVVLTGDGGDELFAGYDAYLDQRRHTQFWPLRKTIGALEQLRSKLGWHEPDPAYLFYPLPSSNGGHTRWLDIRSQFDIQMVGQLIGTEVTSSPAPRADWPSDPLAQAQQFDLNVYLPDNLLKKVDMMSMMCGLEARAPFLDHRVIEFALQIPPRENVRGGVTKSLLREVLHPLLPDSVLRGTKQGFGAPLVSWLSRGPVRELAHSYLEGHAKIYSIIDETVARRTISSSFANLNSNWRAPLRIWTLLMLELWARAARA